MVAKTQTKRRRRKSKDVYGVPDGTCHGRPHVASPLHSPSHELPSIQVTTVSLRNAHAKNAAVSLARPESPGNNRPGSSVPRANFLLLPDAVARHIDYGLNNSRPLPTLVFHHILPTPRHDQTFSRIPMHLMAGRGCISPLAQRLAKYRIIRLAQALKLAHDDGSSNFTPLSGSG